MSGAQLRAIADHYDGVDCTTIMPDDIPGWLRRLAGEWDARNREGAVAHDAVYQCRQALMEVRSAINHQQMTPFAAYLALSEAVSEATEHTG